MKRTIFLIIGLMVLMIVPVFSQKVEPVPPDDIIEWISRFPEMIGSFWGVYVSVLLLPSILFGVLNVGGKGLKYVLTGAIALILILLAHFISFGYLYEAPVWRVPLNWVFLLGAQVVGYAVLKPLLDAIENKFNPRQPSGPVG